MILADLSARKRHDNLWLMLQVVLQDLAEVVDTRVVVDQLCKRLETKETEIVSRWLTKVAPLVPEASRTGESFRLYGNIARRWQWAPRGGLRPEPVAESGVCIPKGTVLCDDGVIRSMHEMLEEWQ